MMTYTIKKVSKVPATSIVESNGSHGNQIMTDRWPGDVKVAPTVDPFEESTLQRVVPNVVFDES